MPPPPASDDELLQNWGPVWSAKKLAGTSGGVACWTMGQQPADFSEESVQRSHS